MAGITATPLVECKALAMRFDGLRAVAGIDLTVSKGESLGIAGANGAGKSTLMNLLAGRYRPTEGDISLSGRPIAGLRPDQLHRLGVARTFQRISNANSLTVFENVCLAAAYHRARRRSPLRFSSGDVERANRVIARTGLVGREAQPAGELSVFEQRRLMLAAALASDPVLLLLDEPVAGLLPDEIADFAGMLADVRDMGVSVIVIEHIMSFLRQFTPERILVMHQGARLFEGTASEVEASPIVRTAWLGGGETADTLEEGS